jgi:hypothetical protein
MKYFFTCELPISADHFWQIKDTAEYMEFVKQKTPFKELSLIEKRIENDKYYTKIRSLPVISIEGLIKKFFRITDLACINEWECSVNPPYIGKLKIITPIKSDKVLINGTICTLPKNENECIQKAEINFDINMFGGSIIENKLCNEFEKTYKRMPLLIAEFLNQPTQINKNVFSSHRVKIINLPDSKRIIPLESNYSSDSDKNCEHDVDKMPTIIKKIETIEMTEQYEYLSASSGVISEIHSNYQTNTTFYSISQPPSLTQDIFYSAKKNIKPKWYIWSFCIKTRKIK